MSIKIIDLKYPQLWEYVERQIGAASAEATPSTPPDSKASDWLTPEYLSDVLMEYSPKAAKAMGWQTLKQIAEALAMPGDTKPAASAPAPASGEALKEAFEKWFQGRGFWSDEKELCERAWNAALSYSCKQTYMSTNAIKSGLEAKAECCNMSDGFDHACVEIDDALEAIDAAASAPATPSTPWDAQEFVAQWLNENAGIVGRESSIHKLEQFAKSAFVAGAASAPAPASGDELREALQYLVKELNKYAAKNGLGPAMLMHALGKAERALAPASGKANVVETPVCYKCDDFVSESEVVVFHRKCAAALAAAQPAAKEMTANEMLESILGSLRGWPHAACDMRIGAEVERIQKEAIVRELSDFANRFPGVEVQEYCESKVLAL